jgi:hypothetical protein
MEELQRGIGDTSPTSSNASSQIAESALGMGQRDDKDDVVLLLKDQGIRELFQDTPTGVLCIQRIELRMRYDLREGSIDFGQKGSCCFRAALEIPLERSVDLFPSLEPDAEGFLIHLPNRACNGAFTSSQE